VTHESDCLRALTHDDLGGNAQHVIPEPREVPVPARVSRALPSVHLTIHLHDQAERRSDEVRHVAIGEHDLPAKRYDQPTAAKLAPERAFRLMRVEPHAPSASCEDVLSCWTD
jgi:hypothetical protein